jgi:hypothetical protein
MRASVLPIIILAYGLAATSAAYGQAQPATADFCVAPGGSDSNPGTPERPFASIARAKEAVRRRIAAGLNADVKVVLRGGVYTLTEPVLFGPEDSGTEKHAITYAAHPGEQVVLSGGRKITGWQKGDGPIWTATVPGVREGKWHFRNLFVAGRRAVRARTPNRDDKTPAWQLTGADLSKDLKRFTVTLAPGLVKNWSNPGDIEMMIAGNWAINRKRVESLDEKAGRVVLAPPHIRGEGYIMPSAGRWCHFENAREMLDQPGEWHLGVQTGVLSYWPLPGEEMSRVEVVAPALVQLVKIAGQAGRPVRNLHFQGIAFEHTDWPVPPGGYMGIQACHYSTAGSGPHWPRILAAVACTHAENCSVEDGTLAHMGGCGIELADGCRNNLIRGNRVFDISGNGIDVGGPTREPGVPVGNTVSNNHVYDCGVEYYGAIGIWVGITDSTTVSHNLVHGLPYTGISVGWQWNPQPTPCQKNLIEYNHVYDVMNRLCDGGCTYTLGFQPGTVIRGNHLHDVHRSPLAQGAPNNGMFIDEGSKGFLFDQNVIYNTSAELVRFNQCQKDWHTWRDNHFGDAAAVKESGKAIIEKAGLDPRYRQRLMEGK